jgi:hypothetical protein
MQSEDAWTSTVAMDTRSSSRVCGERLRRPRSGEKMKEASGWRRREAGADE